jgi:hypothetical protein
MGKKMRMQIQQQQRMRSTALKVMSASTALAP